MKGSAKAAGRTSEEAAAPPEAPLSEDDRRIRALILAELDRRGVRPVARRTLALIAEGSVEPADGVPGYRIVDRGGVVRLRGAGEGAGVPLTLHELVEELREQHAPLFLPPAPEPEPEAPRDAIADVRAAGARFVETQSALARSLANTSAERSRALASAASETVEGWRSRLAERLKARPRPAPVSAPITAMDGMSPSAATAPDAAQRLTEARARLGAGWQRLADGLQPGQTLIRVRDLVDDALSAGSRRPVVLMTLGALAGAGLVAALSLRGGTGEEAGSAARSGSETQTAQTAPAGAPPASGQRGSDEPAPDAPPSETPEARPPEPEPRRSNSNALTGIPEVIDTATLRVGGKVVRLFGVEWVRGGQADELSKYLRGRQVSCQPAPGSSAHICTVEGRDLSEVVLFNGGGRASAEATPDLAAAEDHARTERLGVWKR